jgi:hypothetical protein
MHEERNTLDSLGSMSETRSAIINVEGYVPWENFAVLPNTLGRSEASGSHNEAMGQAKEASGASRIDESHGRDASCSSCCDPDEHSDVPGRFHASGQQSVATESQFAMGRFSGTVRHPDACEFPASLPFDLELCERQHQARFVTLNSSDQSPISLTCLSSSSQPRVSAGDTTTPTTTQSTTTETDSLSCVTCHKSFARPCELT